MSWLQYVLGLRALGHDVLYLEDTGGWYYDPKADRVIENPQIPVQHLSRIMDEHGLGDCWAFIDHSSTQYGISSHHLNDFVDTADLLIHVTGAMYLTERYLRIPRRAYVDTDPGFIQLRVKKGSQSDANHLANHSAHFSFGCNIGQPNCLVPPGNIYWIPTAQPLYMPLWPQASHAGPRGSFTTFVKWDASGHGPIELGDKSYGLKDIEFLKFLDLPLLTGQRFELAMAGAAPVTNLEAIGWHCRGPEISSSISQYRSYIHGSLAEWTIAKNGYVALRTGWFSDRSASYLASGRPVLTQSTGFEDWLPTGLGLFAFSTVEEAVAAIEELLGNYEKHCAAARDIAIAYFDSQSVLNKILGASLSE